MGKSIKPIVVKKSPMVMAQYFVLLECLVTIFFFVLAPLADYGEVYEATSLSSFLAFSVAEALALVLVQAGIVFGIFFVWFSSTYVFSRARIMSRSGIFVKRSTGVALADVQTVGVRQSLLARAAHYGTLELHTTIGRHLKLRFVPEPRKYANLVMRFKQGAPTPVFAERADVHAFLASSEHEQLEFKTTFRWDMREHKVNRLLERTVMKTIAAFLNSQGGSLVIGIDDMRQVIGLAGDYATLGQRGADGFENHFSNVFRTMIGPELRQFVKLSFPVIDGKECCLVQVAPSPRPAYLKADDRSEEFYVRTGNATTSLTFSEAASYIASRFEGTMA